MPKPSLSAESLRIDRGEVPVLDGVTFKLQAGEALLLRGANGSGKTTLLRCLAGFVPPAAGSLSRAGIPAIGWCGIAPALKPSETPASDLAFWARRDGRADARAVVRSALAHFGVARLANRPARLLSAGQKQRINLARLSVMDRRLWLMDEPASYLDDAGTDRLRETVANHLECGGLAVIATHQDLGLGGRARTLRLVTPETAPPGAAA